MEKAVKGMRLAEFDYLIERCKIREMADAVGDPNPLYRDRAAARAEGFTDVIAPPTFGTCVNLWGGPSFQALCEKLGGEPLKILHAEHAYEFFGPIYPGQTLHAAIDVADLYTKEGRSGRMTFCVLETTYHHDGKKVLVGRSTLLQRG